MIVVIITSSSCKLSTTTNVLPYCVVGATGHHQPISILQTRYSALVSVQRPNELARCGVPDFNRAVAGC